MLLVGTQLLQSSTLASVLDEELRTHILGFYPEHYSGPDSHHVDCSLGGTFANCELLEGHLVIVLCTTGFRAIGHGEIMDDVPDTFEVCNMGLGELPVVSL